MLIVDINCNVCILSLYLQVIIGGSNLDCSAKIDTSEIKVRKSFSIFGSAHNYSKAYTYRRIVEVE